MLLAVEASVDCFDPNNEPGAVLLRLAKGFAGAGTEGVLRVVLWPPADEPNRFDLCS